MRLYHHVTMLLLLTNLSLGQIPPRVEQDYLVATDGQITYGTFVDARADIVTFIPLASPNRAPQSIPQSNVRRVVRADGSTAWRNSLIAQRYADILELFDGRRVSGLYVSRTATYFRFLPSGYKALREYATSQVAKVTLADKSLIYLAPSLRAKTANPPATSTRTISQSANRATIRDRGIIEPLITNLLALGGTFLAVSFVLYFIPALIARSREVQHTIALFALNLLLGWTLIGWVAAIIWAFRGGKKTASLANSQP